MGRLNSILNDVFKDQGSSSSVIFTNQLNEIQNAYEKIALIEANKYKASAVFFRKYKREADDQIVSIPIVYIYDNTNNKFSDEDLGEIHKKLWNSQTVFLYLVINDTYIRFYNPHKPVNVDENGIHPIPLTDAIKISAEISQKLEEQKLSSQFLESNLFIEYFKDEYLEEFSPHHILLDYLSETRKKLLSNSKFKLPENLLNKFLVMLILIKYLEEKEDKEGTKLVDIDTYIWKKHNAKSFTEILKAGSIVTFLKDLYDKFNGNVFYLSEDEKKSIDSLNDYQQNLLAGYFDAEIDPYSESYFLWKKYSFNNLPIELISGIYEAFLPKKTSDVVYTPPYLVNLMIDETMPLDKPELFTKGDFKIFDPACGSGIFMVSAFKRLVEWQILNDFEKSGEWSIPKPDVLKQILWENIFGTDIQKGAQEIAIYSLSIALCRFLSPISIWDNLQFDDLSKSNILDWDFFKLWNEKKDIQEEKFDLVIGNPPFKNLEKKDFNVILNEYKIKPVSEIPGPQIAFLFLNTAIDLLKPKAKLSLVLPSQLIYNQAQVAIDFQQYFFQKYCVERINDFSFLRDVIFKEKKVAVCSLTLSNKDIPENHSLTHTVFQCFSKHENRLFFEVDYYDIHKVDYSIVLMDHFIWKNNLLGGGRLYDLTKRFKDFRTFGKYLDEKKENNKWIIGEGYDLVTKKERAEGIDYVSEKYPKAPHITDYDYVENKDFTLSGIEKVQLERSIHFHGPREDVKEIFFKPHTLIREIPDLPVHFLDYDLRFKNGIIGIHAPENEDNIELLKKIEEIFSSNRNLYKFCIFVTSNRTAISRGGFYSAQKSDIMNLPFPEDFILLELNQTELVIIKDVLDNYSKLYKKSSINPLNQLANFNGYISTFNETFCYVLNKIYKTEEYEYRPGNVLETPLFYCVAFHYGKIVPEYKLEYKDDIDKELKMLIENDLGYSYRINRFVKYYTHKDDDDLIYLIKPKMIRYWLQSIALRDADEVISDLIESGF